MSRLQASVQARAHERRWWILAVLCLSLLIIIVDNSILNVAIPTIVHELGASNSELQWILDAYTLVFAGLLLTAGSLGDRFGRRGALQVGLAIFGVGSLAAGLSNSAGMLIGTRAVMGVGAAAIMPATLSILTNLFSAEERPKAIGFWAATSGVGAILGPITGGFLIEHFSWGAVFLVNVPIILVGLASGFFLVPTSKDPAAPRLDVPGALLSIVGLTALLYAIIEAPVRGWGSIETVGMFAVSLLVLAAFAARELRTDHPMLNLTFFANARFTAGSLTMTLVFFAMFGLAFLTTQYFQFVLGYAPLATGLRFLPWAVTMIVVSVCGARLTGRFGHTAVVGPGLLLVGGSLLSYTQVDATTDYASGLLPRMVVMAIGFALVMGPLAEAIMGSLPRANAGVGSAMNDTTRQTGGALGIAVVGSVLASVYGSRMSEFLAGKGVPAGARISMQRSIGYTIEYARGPAARVAGLADAARDAFMAGMHVAVSISAAAAFVAAVVVFRWLPARGHDDPRADTAVHDEGLVTGVAVVPAGRTSAEVAGG